MMLSWRTRTSTSPELLQQLREDEIGLVAGRMPAGARVLEVGAGTGTQARWLGEHGFRVLAIDLPGAVAPEDQVFPVSTYDGGRFPVGDASQDVVFSSNVLEHVTDLPRLHAEVRRVLKPGGLCLHVLPSGTWAFWEAVTYYPGVGPSVARQVAATLRRGDGPWWRRAWVALRYLAPRGVPRRHGARGVLLLEPLVFSRRAWVPHFRRHGWVVEEVLPLGVFYTGRSMLDTRWDLPRRRRLARVLGSSSILYRLRPAS